jgi:hypothetical protein
VRKKLELAGEKVLKLFTTFIAIGCQFHYLGFILLIGRMTEVLAPDIYIELTGVSR